MSQAQNPLRGLMQPTPLNVADIFTRMHRVFGDGDVVSQEGRRTYADVAERIVRLCRVLIDSGVEPGDRIGTFATNTARHFELYYAAPLIGAVIHPINVRLHADEITYVANHAADRMLFVDGDLADQIDDLRPRLTSIERFVRLDEHGSGLPAAAVVDDLIAEAAPLTELPAVAEDVACALCYTSGTTGRPKGVLYSHRAVWLHAMATNVADHIGLRESDRVLPIVPLYHALGWGLPYSAPMCGAELVFHGADNSPEHLGAVIAGRRVTVAAAVPTIWKTLLPLLEAGAFDGSTLRLVFAGGSASPRRLIEAYDQLGIDYLQVWGMTETGPLACASRPRRRHRHLDASARLDVRERTGTIFAGLDAEILDEAGDGVAQDGEQVGELAVRGPWIASAYYGDDTSEATFAGGWMRTGDMAQIEPDGYIRIVDRAKDLVKSGGEWISTVELEGHLLAHPQITDAAVVGVPSAKWDERPVAVIVPAPGERPSLDSIHDFLAPRVAKWWLPDAVVTTDAIPRTSVGKIDKRALREMLSTNKSSGGAESDGPADRH